MILVAGITNIETTVAVEGFPLAYTKSRFAFHGIADRLGGVGYNVALALARLGAPTMLATLLGHDVMGDVIEAQLRRIPGLRLDATVRHHERSLRSVVLKTPDGAGAITTDLKESQETSFPEATLRAALREATLVHASNINWALEVARRARALGLPVATDVQAITDPFSDAYNQRFLELADFVFLSGENLKAPPADVLTGVLQRYPARAVVVTLAGEGVLFAERGSEPHHQPAPPLPGAIRTATGAGDHFAAGFLKAAAEKKPLDQCCLCGQISAGRWITTY